MSKGAKIWLITAAVLVVLGLFMFVGVLLTQNWDFAKFGSVTYVTNTQEVSMDFDKININVDTAQVEFVPSENEDCKVVCYETEKIRHTVAVNDGALEIKVHDSRKWYEFVGISFGTPKLTLYVPNKEYDSLCIETDTGDVNLPKEFAFKDVTIAGDTSDVYCNASISGTISIALSTGNIELDGIAMDQLLLSTSTGDVRLRSVTVDNDIKIETDTGDVILENCDAADLFIETSTGDVRGTLLSEKVFIADSSTGRVSVPKTVTGGRCEIISSTGNITVDIKS